MVLVVALLVLIKASDGFTHAAERIGIACGLPRFVIGVTIIAIGTSLPELISSVVAELQGASEIVSGNVVGSNVTNLLLVLGLAAVLDGHIRIKREIVHVDLPFLAGSAFFLALVLWDGRVGRLESAICLFGAMLFTWYAVASGQGRPDEHESGAETDSRPVSVWTVVGLVGFGALIYASAELTVLSVIESAALLGIGKEVIAATVVALGTSLPEVAVTVSAARRGTPEMAVGNVLGSNVFNSFAVIGVSGLVGTLHVPATILEFALPLMVIATVLGFFTIMEKEVTLWEGWLLILFYVYFVGALFGLM